jgi:hypothetical protein
MASRPKITPLVLKRRPAAFDSPDYLYEPKYDGFRALLEIDAAAHASSRATATASSTSTLWLQRWRSACVRVMPFSTAR